MNNTPTTVFDELRKPISEPRVVRHDVTFQLRIVAFNGQPVDDESKYGKALMDTDDKVYDALKREVSNWSFRDHYGIDCERLDFYQPEYGYDETQPENVSFYDVGVFATRPIPLKREDATEDFPISVEQLVAEALPIILREYAAAGVTLEVHKVTFHQQLECSVSGYYDVG